MAAQGKTVVDAGGVIIEILETRSFGAPTKADLDAWVKTYKLPVTSLIDPASKPLQTFNSYGRRENTFVVDLRTMKILKKVSGS
ncbi:MAG: hypothetical protein ACXVIJ_14430, partial [Thermoanaerobaculia bacterium]